MDKSNNVPIVTALIAATVTMLGWAVSQILARRREDRARRVETHLREYEREVSEFYGPLHSLIQQIFTVYRVREALLAAIPEDKRQSALQLVWSQHFLPLHSEIHELMKSKLYLCRTNPIPDSFWNYLEHSTYEMIQNLLAEKVTLDVTQVETPSWPLQFSQDVREGIQSRMQGSARLLRDLESTVAGPPRRRSPERQRAREP